MRKLRFRYDLLGRVLKIALPILIAAALFLIFFDRIAVAVLSRAFDVDVSYGRIWNIHYREFLFDDLKVVYKKKGVGISARSSNVRPFFTKNFPRSMAFDILLKDISFIKKEAKAEKYDTLDGLLALPFGSQLIYPSVKGRIECFPDRVSVEDFTASGSDVKLTFKGDIYYDRKVDGEVRVHFSGDILKKIPDEIAGVLLADEGAGWKGLSVKLSGDYASPSVQFTGKMFRLSIKNVKKGN